MIWNKIPDLLQDKPEGVPASEIETKIGVEADKVARILRYLTTKHVFEEGEWTTYYTISGIEYSCYNS